MKAISLLCSQPIKGFYETSFVDWHGRISSVIFLSGCNLRCPYCHNHPLILKSDFLPSISQYWIAERLKGFIGWIDGLVISGGEPCLYPQLPQVIEFFRRLPFPVKLDTNGTKPDLLASLLEKCLIDYVAMDVKAPLDDIRYSRCTGVPMQVANIKRSIEILAHAHIDYELRMTVCPVLTKKGDIQDLAKQIEGVPKFVLQSFSPKDPLDPTLKSVSPYSKEQMLEFKEILGKYVKECRLII